MGSSASSDEGEIRDETGSVEKATTSLPQFNGTSVDRQDRIRTRDSISTSPEHGHRSKDRRSRERSRSPYSERPPRGSKRPRGDDYADRSRGDPRRFKVHYEDAPKEYTRRPRVSYEDIDHGSDLRYDDRDRYAEKRPRTRSRSPHRFSRGGERDNYGGQLRHGGNRDTGRPNYGNGDVRNRDPRDQPVSKRAQSPLPADNARREAKVTQGYSHNDKFAKNLELEKSVWRKVFT